MIMKTERLLAIEELAEGKAAAPGTRVKRGDGRTYMKMTSGTWEKLAKDSKPLKKPAAPEKKLSRSDRVHNFVSRNMSKAAQALIIKHQDSKRKG